MNTVVLDTSNKYLVIGLFQDGKCLESIQEEGNRKQSEYAIVYLKKVLDKHNLKVLDIDEMIITIGPGSYTGQRVALTIAKIVGSTTNVKIKAISSLLGYAGNNQAISVIDARSHKLYVGIYNDGQLMKPEQLVDIDDFDEYVKDYIDYPVVGDGQLVNQPVLDVDLNSNIYQVAKDADYVKDIDNLVPRYIKDVEAKKIC